jgi:ferredoxin
MNVTVDPERCQGHNRCHALAPTLFDIDDLGYATAAPGDIDPDLETAARLAAANCPEHAITIEP